MCTQLIIKGSEIPAQSDFFAYFDVTHFDLSKMGLYMRFHTLSCLGNNRHVFRQ